MRKWTLGWIGLGVAVLGLLIWVISSLGIHVPRVHVVHLETPGGPVPIAITFLSPSAAYIRIGHENAAGPLRLSGGNQGDFVINEVQWSPFGFEIEFPRNKATLTISTVESDDGETSLEGVLAYSDSEIVVEEIPASAMRVVRQNWFDAADTDVPSSTDRNINGTWIFKSKLGSEVARIRLDAYVPNSHTVAQAEAEVLTFLSTHRYFLGVVTGNRIRLASFDNAYPALIDAAIQDDGTLKGDLWVGDRLHESFVGVRE